jgi:hypothetical protein
MINLLRITINIKKPVDIFNRLFYVWVTAQARTKSEKTTLDDHPNLNSGKTQ